MTNHFDAIATRLLSICSRGGKKALTRISQLHEISIEQAERVADQTGERLDVVLTRLGLISETELAATIAQQFRWGA